METLNPKSTNRMWCETCGFTRIIDHTRPYRGSHTHPEHGYECTEPLRHEELSPKPPEIFLLGETDAFPDPTIPNTGTRTKEQEAKLEEIFEDDTAMGHPVNDNN